MAEIEESRLRIVVDTDKASKGTKELTQDLNDNTKAGNNAAKGAGDLTKMLKGLATGYVGLMVVRGVTNELKKSTQAARDKENAYKRLESIAKTVTKATDEEIQSLRRVANQLQENTALANDVAEAGLSQILSYGTTVEQADKLSLSLANLVAANKGVNATQDDGINAANMMGKALAGQAGALTKAGIIMDEHQKKLIQNGDMTTRVNTLVAVMEQNYGGLAKGLAQTNEGLAKMQDNKLADMRAELGEKMLPAVLDLKTAFVDFYQFIVDNEGAVVGSVKAISKVISSASLALSWWTKQEQATAEQLARFEDYQKKMKSASKTVEEYTSQMKEWSEWEKKGNVHTAETAELMAHSRFELEKATNERDTYLKLMKESVGIVELSIPAEEKSTEAIIDKAEALRLLNEQLKKQHEELTLLYGFDESNNADAISDIENRFNSLWYSVDEGKRKEAELLEVTNLLAEAQKMLGISSEQADAILQQYLKSLTAKEQAAEIKKTQKEVEKSNQAMIDNAIATGEQFASTMAEQLAKGKADWGSFAVFVVGQIGKIITELLIMKAVQAGASAIGGGGVTANANGNSFDGQGIKPFANGGVVDSPTLFSFGNSKTGVMGEAGAEAILPLKRKNGKLGVVASGGGETVISPNVNVVVQGNATNETAAQIGQATKQITKAVTDSILQDIRSGGKMARAVGRRV